MHSYVASLEADPLFSNSGWPQHYQLVADDTDWVRCSVTPASSNFDASWFAAAIELEGTVQEGFPFGDGKELFDTGLKYLNKLIVNTWRTKIFESNIFVYY